MRQNIPDYASRSFFPFDISLQHMGFKDDSCFPDEAYLLLLLNEVRIDWLDSVVEQLNSLHFFQDLFLPLMNLCCVTTRDYLLRNHLLYKANVSLQIWSDLCDNLDPEGGDSPGEGVVIMPIEKCSFTFDRMVDRQQVRRRSL